MAGAWCRALPWRALACEFLACFFLNFFGCGAAIATGNYGYYNYTKKNHSVPNQFVYGKDYHTAVSVAFALVVAGNVALFQRVSGGHANPAVTLGALVIRKVALLKGLLYVPAQLLGCLVGSALLKVLTPPLRHRTDVFVPAVNQDDDEAVWRACAWELCLGFLRVLVFLEVSRDKEELARATGPLLIGTAVLLSHLACLFATTGCTNPARALGAAVVSQDFTNLWVFVVFAPLGGIAGAVLHHFFFMDGKRDDSYETFSPGGASAAAPE